MKAAVVVRRAAPLLAARLSRGGYTFISLVVAVALLFTLGLLAYGQRDRLARLIRSSLSTTEATRVLPAGKSSPQETTAPASTAQPASGNFGQPVQSNLIALFVPDESGEKLLRLEVPIPNAVDESPRVEKVMQLLLQHSLLSKAGPLPEGAQLLAYFLTPSGSLYLDFNKTFLNHPKGSWGEALTVFALVNSFAANVPNVKNVRILIEGKSTGTLAGHLDLSRAFYPRDLQSLELEGDFAAPQESNSATEPAAPFVPEESVRESPSTEVPSDAGRENGAMTTAPPDSAAMTPAVPEQLPRTVAPPAATAEKEGTTNEPQTEN